MRADGGWVGPGGRLHLGDVVAGISVALVLVPQSLAYAQLAGMPAHRGLYAAALPPLAAAFLASSPHLQTGPTAITALLTFAALASLAPVGSPEYVGLGLLLALVVGAIRLLVGLLRVGVVAFLMSQPMLLGFVPAAAIQIIVSQLPAALGTDKHSDGVVQQIGHSVANPGEWEGTSLVLSAVVVGVILLGPRLHALLPVVLVAVALGLGFSLLTDYGGPIVGSIPASFPPLSLDLPWSELPSLLLPGAVIALVGFAEPASVARTLASLERRRWDPNREFVSQGAANVVAGISGGFPVGGSFSRSAISRLAGGQTRWSGAVAGLAVLAFIPFAPALERLPRAVLGAIVIAAVIGLVRPLPVLRLWRYSRPQFAVGAVTAVLTIALSPHAERAVLVGLVLAVGIHLWRELAFEIDIAEVSGTLHVRPRGVLWYGTTRNLEEACSGLLAEHAGARRWEIHLDGLGRLDVSGALALHTLVADARRAGVDVRVVDVPAHARRLLPLVEGDEELLGGG